MPDSHPQVDGLADVVIGGKWRGRRVGPGVTMRLSQPVQDQARGEARTHGRWGPLTEGRSEEEVRVMFFSTADMELRKVWPDEVTLR